MNCKNVNIRFNYKILTYCDLEADFALCDVGDVTSYENLCRQICKMKKQSHSMHFNISRMTELRVASHIKQIFTVLHSQRAIKFSIVSKIHNRSFFAYAIMLSHSNRQTTDNSSASFAN